MFFVAKSFKTAPYVALNNSNESSQSKNRCWTFANIIKTPSNNLSNSEVIRISFSASYDKHLKKFIRG